VHRRAAGAGELLLVDVFSRGVGKPRCGDNAQAYLAERLEPLRSAIDEVNRLAEVDQLPDA
jgi:hypothetical protein